jgi:hypothetical protein
MAQEYGFTHYFNSSHSPDLAPIEKAWQLPKHSVRTLPHWDIASTKALAEEGWDNLTQETINKWCDKMPELLQRVIDSGGKMIGD